MNCARQLALILALSAPLLATNGMNLEGFGPIATGTGGAAMAHANGTGAMMSNPATLGLMADGDRRIEMVLGYLGPDVGAAVATPQGSIGATSAMDAIFMPALGWAQKRGHVTWGLGVFAQGGMGTEFSRSSWLADPSQGTNAGLTQGLLNRTEVSVGRVILPLVYDVDERLHVGGSVDLVWAGIDIQMALSEAQFVDLVTTQQRGTAGGSLTQVFGALYEPFGGTGVRRLHHAYFDFANDSDFTGQANGMGLAAKIGVVYEVSQELTVGATYHSKTAIGNLETDQALMRMGVNADTGLLTTGTPNGQYADLDLPVAGRVTIDDFQWPATLGLGVAYRAQERLHLVADLRRIQWSGVMQGFRMQFTAADTPQNGGFAGQRLDTELLQKWEDQTVLAFGAAYDVNHALQVRAGFNTGSNPVPDALLNALFPAIVERHFTLGAGYQLTQRTSLQLSYVRGSEAKFTNPGDGVGVPPVTSTHGQNNLQVMYTFGW